MQKTQNYNLNQWEPTDEVRREEFNADNAAIDAALKAVADTANGKAGAAEVSALQQSVNSQIAALSTALGSGGQNLRIHSGSYIGNGKFGSTNPVKLSAPFYPMVVLCGSTENSYMPSWPTTLIRGVNSGHYECGGEKITVAWSENSVSYYNASDASSQNNYSGYTYYYVILGYSL